MIYLSPFIQKKRTDLNAKNKTFKEHLSNFAHNIEGSLLGLWRVLQLVWDTSHRLTLGLGLFTLLQAIIPAASIYTTKLLIDGVTEGIRHNNLINSYLHLIIILTILQMALSIASYLSSSFAAACKQLLQDATTYRVQHMIMAHASTLDLTFFEQSEFYNKLQTAQHEAGYRPINMVSGAFDLIRSMLTFLTMITLLIRLQWFIALIVLLTPIPALIAETRYGWKSFQLTERQAHARRITLYLTHLLTTDLFYKEIKVFQLGNFFLNRFKALVTHFCEENQSLLIKRSFIGSLWGMLTVLASTGSFLYVAILALFSIITIGDLTLYAQAVASLQNNFQSMLKGIGSLYEDNLYLGALFDLLALRPFIANPSSPVSLELPFKEGIEFRNVTFQYTGAKEPTLYNISFSLKPGQTMALVGSNGAGKTTLVKLLTRLYDPQEGQILVNGRDIRDYAIDELRATIGVIFQDYVRYHLTVQENIGVGKLTQLTDLKLVEQAAAKGGADDLIARLPNGYDTVLGRWFEKGHELSGGEWQKIALSRAFMRDAQILILDEPTASLDAKAEYDLFLRIREITRGHTAIFISHRFSTVRLADHILVLENGKVIEYGNHEELLAAKGHYAELFDLQAASYR